MLMVLRKLFGSDRALRAQAAELARANDHLRTTVTLIRETLASVDETFLLLAPDGVCFASPTPNATETLGLDPEGRHLNQILDIAPNARDEVDEWLTLLCRDDMSFETVRELGPARFTNPHSGRTYRVRYFPMRADGRIENVIVTLLDVTDSLEAIAARAAAEARANFILAITRHREAFARFVTEVPAFAADASRAEPEDLRRHLHTLKGTAGVFFVTPLVRVIHEIELELNAAADPAFIVARVASEIPRALDEFLDAQRAVFDQLRTFDDDSLIVPASILKGARAHLGNDPTSLAHFDATLRRLRARDLGAEVMKFETHVVALAERMNRRARVRLADDSVFCALLTDRYADVLKAAVHLFNNAVDHGLESVDARRAQGKPESGTILCGVHHATLPNGRRAVEIRITDDGSGIDPAQIRRALRERGHAAPDDLADHDVLQQVFALGLSTRDLATETSGLGVGLNGLKNVIERHRGSITVTSRLGLGTTFSIVLPAPAEVIWFESPARTAAA